MRHKQVQLWKAALPHPCLNRHTHTHAPDIHSKNTDIHSCNRHKPTHTHTPTYSHISHTHIHIIIIIIKKDAQSLYKMLDWLINWPGKGSCLRIKSSDLICASNETLKPLSFPLITESTRVQPARASGDRTAAGMSGRHKSTLKKENKNIMME